MVLFMILEFIVKNYRSIYSEVDLNLLATADKKLETNCFVFNDHKYLKSIEIYGPNGSGKSTILDSLILLKELVIGDNDEENRLTSRRRREELPFFPHKMHQDEPTEFHIWFVKNDQKFLYELAYDSEKILAENLYIFNERKLNKPQIVYERTLNSFITSKEYKNEFGNTDKEIKDQKLILTIASDITNIQPIREAYDFFAKYIYTTADLTSNNIYKRAVKLLQSDNDLRKQYIDFFSKFCIGLKDITARLGHINFDDLQFPDEISEKVKNQILTSISNNPIVNFHYQNYTTSIEEESSGTRLMFRLLFLLITAIKNEAVCLFDEIETHLHPALLKEVIRYFYSFKDSRAQLICTTNNLELLDQNIIRRDQIWFTENNPESKETEFYSLAEYKGVRNDENLRKGYIENRYGAWPNIQFNNY